MWLLTLIFVAPVICHDDILWSPATQNIKEDGIIKQVHVLFRHGHRVPMTRFPTDPNAHADLWQYGKGQLTNLGRQQGYKLGQNLKIRYGTSLPKERAWTRVFTASSDVSRTLMTAQVVLAGLLPPQGVDKWSSIDWQPSPIHTKPKNIDNILSSKAKYCPKYEQLLNNSTVTMSTYQLKLYQYISEKSGLPMNSEKDIERLYTCLHIESEAGLKLPDWTKPVFPDFMKNVSLRYLLRTSKTKESIRLSSGPLLEKLLSFNEFNNPLNLYSTHDTVLVSLLGALGIKNVQFPGFTSVIAIEYRDTLNGTHAQLWWREKPNDLLQRLEWPGCGIRCPIERLRQIYDPLIPDNWSEECSLKIVFKTTKEVTVEGFIPITLISLTILFFFITFALLRKKSRYELIP